MSKPQYFPKENYTLSYWLTQQNEFSSHRTTEKLPAEVDVLIIGSGYAGTSTAYFLQQQDPSLKVALFEARTICSGATGRNGGHIKPYCHRYYEYYESFLGERGVAEVVNSEIEHLWALKKLIDDNEIDCDFYLTRACDVYPRDDDPRIEMDLRCAKKMLQNPFISDELKKQFQILYGEQARIVSKNPHTDIAITYPAASCWPWKLMTSILKKLVDSGLNLQANTLVTEVVPLDNKWLVKTERGTTLAKKVVYCTNGYTKSLLSDFDNAIVPQKGVCCSIEPEDKTNIPHLTNTYGIFSSRPISCYLINRLDGTVIIGGKDGLMFTDEGPDQLKGFFNDVDDSFVSEKCKKEFGTFMQDTYSTWKNTKTQLSHIWSGILGYTNDFLPYVGELDCIGKKNSYIVAGFHGHGMPRVFLSGKAIATCITQNKSIHDIEYVIPRGFSISIERLQKKNVHEEEMRQKAAEQFAEVRKSSNKFKL